MYIGWIVIPIIIIIAIIGVNYLPYDSNGSMDDFD